MLGRRGFFGLCFALAAGCQAGPAVCEPRSPVAYECQSLPQSCRSSVHVFLLNGRDPCDREALEDLRAYCINLGFCRTSAGELYHTSTFADSIRKLHCCDPDARFVLVGSGAAHDLARTLASEGVGVALVLTLDVRPPAELYGTARILDVRSAFFGPETAAPGAELVRVPHTRPGQLATHAFVRDLLAHELVALAQSVPVAVVAAESGVFAPVPAARAKPSAPQADDRAWGFLEPVKELSAAPPLTILPTTHLEPGTATATDLLPTRK